VKLCGYGFRYRKSILEKFMEQTEFGERPDAIRSGIKIVPADKAPGQSTPAEVPEHHLV